MVFAGLNKLLYVIDSYALNFRYLEAKTHFKGQPTPYSSQYKCLYTYCHVLGKHPWALAAKVQQRKNLGWAVTRRRYLNGSTIPAQGPTPDANLAARGYRIVASSVLHQGQPDSGGSCIVLQSGLTCSLVAKFPQLSVITYSTQILCCRERTLRMRPWTGVCKPLMPDVVLPKVHQNNNMLYVSSVDLPSDSLQKNLAWWTVTQSTSKKHKTVKKWDVGACTSLGACPGQYNKT